MKMKWIKFIVEVAIIILQKLFGSVLGMIRGFRSSDKDVKK